MTCECASGLRIRLAVHLYITALYTVGDRDAHATGTAHAALTRHARLWQVFCPHSPTQVRNFNAYLLTLSFVVHGYKRKRNTKLKQEKERKLT